jgi:hypothetical protein
MGVSDEAKNVIPLKFLRKIENKNFFPLVNSIRDNPGHTVYPGTLPKCTKITSLALNRRMCSVLKAVSIVFFFTYSYSLKCWEFFKCL